MLLGIEGGTLAPVNTVLPQICGVGLCVSVSVPYNNGDGTNMQRFLARLHSCAGWLIINKRKQQYSLHTH